MLQNHWWFILIPGQFWNVPVTISSYTGLFGSGERTDDYIITVDHPQSDPRSFVGLKSDVMWEFEKRVCYILRRQHTGGEAGRGG